MIQTHTLTQPQQSAGIFLWLDRLLISAFLLLVFLLGCFSLSNGDILWHLRTGQLILERGELPYLDWYTYTNDDAVWIDLHWGFQVVAALLWDLGGTSWLILAKSLIGMTTIAICLTITRRQWPVWQTIGIWLAPVMIYAGRYYVRPEVVTMLLISVTLAVLYHSAHRVWLIWTLPLIQLIWVNVQGLFVLQFVILGCYLVDVFGRFLWKLVRDEAGRKKGGRGVSFHWRSWSVVIVLTAGAALLNPYGLRGATFPLTLLARVRGGDREFFHRFSGELQGFDSFVRQNGWLAVFQQLTSCLLVMVFIGCVVSFAALLWHGRMSLFRLLLFIAFSYLAWQMKRNSVPFAIVAGVVLRLNLGELLDVTNRTQDPSNAVTTAVGFQRIGPALVAILVGLLVVSVPSDVYFQIQKTTIPKQFGFGQAGWYGHQGAEFLQQPGMPEYVYAQHLGQAAVCIFHLCPKKKVYADARLELNTPETLQRYEAIQLELATNPPAAEEKLLYGIPVRADGSREIPALLFDNLILLRDANLMEALLTNGRWQCVYTDLPNSGPSAASFPQFVLDPTSVGTSVFLSAQRAAELGLPNVLNP